MKNVIFFPLILIGLTSTFEAKALIPLDGLIFGGVEDVNQFDPLKSILSDRFEFQNKEKNQTSKENKVSSNKYYYGVYKQGSELLSYCEQNPQIKYSNQWKKAIAARSVVATLQYIGLDKSLKAIAGYAKKLEYSGEEYQQLSGNLIRNTCSKNLSVYSLKLLKDNFRFAWEKGESLDRSLSNTEMYFSSDYKSRQNTMATLKREFEYTLRNFRAFCSWGGDTSDFRMLVPYLKNPFIMSLVFNHLQKIKIEIEPKTNKIILANDSSGIQVACEDLICRKRSPEDFNRIFPRMTGSTKLKEDLQGLYCEYFSTVRYQTQLSSPQIKKWIEEKTLAESHIESLQFLSLLTQVPDGLTVATSYKGIEQFFVDNIQGRWDLWAEERLGQFINDHMYEEPLEIRLVEQSKTNQVLKGEFSFLFEIGLSELDKVLDEVDKIDSVFSLEMPVKYLAYIKERSEFLGNGSKKFLYDDMYKRIVSRLNYQMKLKKRLFKVDLWTDDIAYIMADELIEQIKNYKGGQLDRLSDKKIKIPVRMRYGVFALRYIHQKYKFQEKSPSSLTYNQ